MQTWNLWGVLARISWGTMVATDDDTLNLNGALIAEAMMGYSVESTIAKYQTMMDGFNAYITTCKALGVG